MNRCRIVVAAVLTACLGLVVLAPSAGASFHDIKIRSFFQGTGGSPQLAFVELQMYSPGQNLVSGQNLKLCSSANTCSQTNFVTNVANGGNQRMILIGDTGVAERDITVAGMGTTLQSLAAGAGGAICYSTIDCVSFGTYSGTPSSPTGTPLAGLPANQVSVRRITAGCPTALDVADDTNSSAADFTNAVGYPRRNNAAVPTETLCPTPTTAKKKKCKKRKKKAGSGDASSAKKKKCKKRKR
jgi:hypothetical protein